MSKPIRSSLKSEWEWEWNPKEFFITCFALHYSIFYFPFVGTWFPFLDVGTSIYFIFFFLYEIGSSFVAFFSTNDVMWTLSKFQTHYVPSHAVLERVSSISISCTYYIRGLMIAWKCCVFLQLKSFLFCWISYRQLLFLL